MLAAAGIAITVAAFYPGILSTDSITQYEQALSGHYTDHHPPLMAWLWSLTNRIVRGPQGMLLLHVALAWSALLLFDPRREWCSGLSLHLLGGDGFGRRRGADAAPREFADATSRV